MTTSVSSAVALREPTDQKPVRQIAQPVSRRRHTLASRLAFLTICVAIVLTTLAYGTVHYWALAVFTISAAGLIAFWAVDAAVLRSALVPVNRLQWPILGLILLGLLQLLPLRDYDDGGLSLSPVRALSLDPYSTRLVIFQVSALLIYFVMTTMFLDTPRRLKALVRTVVIFGFLLAAFGLTQSFTTDGTRVYWFRQLTQSQAFGPFINRHHFAGYMELALAMPLGLLISGALESYKRPLYAFAVVVMAMSLVATNSRGGIISLGAEIFFVLVVGGFTWRRHKDQPRAQRIRSALMRGAAAMAIVLVLLGGALVVSGPEVFTRFLGTPVAEDPTQGRAHFWNVTLDVIKAHPLLGSGLGSFSVIYTRYDTRNGIFRLEQAHNDYLQTLSDAGILGGLLGTAFIVMLFRRGFARRDTHDKFRRGVTTGALAGCFAVLVHSFFDFTLHTTANALLFVIICAVATQDTRVNTTYELRARARRRRRRTEPEAEPATPPPPAIGSAAAL
ncbi:MAG TPA: O-antigen ligase family protein [Pyrinomonadaceae bacterium]|nr:O-antigen ligase family protein [Pyrinomonadaceae bacterium]